ncbi:hypothetical protein BASA61_010573 [Batrachochytrium salamandrivorans]|nr:hypothetical protein BASA61_010573 [Batrachochytrium salamandrivorans]
MSQLPAAPVGPVGSFPPPSSSSSNNSSSLNYSGQPGSAPPPRGAHVQSSPSNQSYPPQISSLQSTQQTVLPHPHSHPQSSSSHGHAYASTTAAPAAQYASYSAPISSNESAPSTALPPIQPMPMAAAAAGPASIVGPSLPQMPSHGHNEHNVSLTPPAHQQMHSHSMHPQIAPAAAALTGPIAGSISGPPISAVPAGSAISFSRLSGAAPPLHAVSSSHGSRSMSPVPAQGHASISPPSNGGSNAGDPNLASSGYRPLNVRDALSYLDQVKVQFSEQPEVYNRFLDIMKDFKSQAIDTPGVIERVSGLFRGHPNLIMGFNTFLPPGYRIEPTNNPNDPVRVTTPRDQAQYNHSHQMNHPSVVHVEHPGYYSSRESAPYSGSNTLPPLSSITSNGPNVHPQSQSHAIVGPNSETATGTGAGTGYGTPINGPSTDAPHLAESQMGLSHSMSGPGRDGPTGSSTPVNSRHSGGQGSVPQSASLTTPPSHSPLPAGQEGARSRGPVEFNHAINYVNKIKNRFSAEPDTYKQFLEILQTYQREGKPIQEVYSQVQILFRGAPDLLDEFKQFLPDNSQQQPHNTQSSQASQLSNSQPLSSQQQPPPPPHPQTPQPQQQSQPQHPLQPSPVPISSPLANTTNAPKSSTSQEKARTSIPTFAGGSGLGNGTMPSTSLGRNSKHSNSEEIEFFEKCKRVIGNKSSYNEFLKLLNLFTQEIIEPKSLVERAEPFLARAPDLFEWFKRFVKYEDHDVIYNIPAERPEIDLRSCKRSGHSYRRLPRDIPRPITSGRDELAKEVLNNDWISHPVYVSETGFVAHKKTPYEEAMYKCEEERYEFDLNIESNLRVIALLEPISKRLMELPVEERPKFKIPHGLGGYSTAIYQRAIKKVYDKDRGAEVIDALHRNPYVAVPVILKRLKQKDEEWKRSQREWNKAWREVDLKNCLKALDHQGIHFKAADRKAMSAKSLVTEIEVMQREQCEKRSNLANRYQFDFAFKKLYIFRHTRRILFHYSENQLSISSTDEVRIGEFLDSFVTRFFLIENIPMYDDDSEDAAPSGNGSDSAMAIDADLSQTAHNENESASDACLPGSQPPKGSRNGVLATMDGTDTSMGMDLDIPMGDTEISVNDGSGNDCKLEHSIRKRTSYSFYANTPIYAFFRLYQMLFSRLQKMSELSDEMEGLPTRSEMYNSVAVELGFQKELGSGLTESDRFSELMKNVIMFVSGDMEATDFEDRARNMFWTSAYLIFTVDKLTGAIIKQVQAILSDPKSMDLISLFYRDHEKPSTSSRQEAMYRLSAETLIQEENVYRFEFFIPERVLTVQLLGKNDQISDDTISSEEKWSLYVDQFVQLSMAEAMGFRRNEPFLKRNLPIEVAEDPPLHVETRSGLELKICVNTYKIFFVDNTEDYFCRKRSDGPSVLDSNMGGRTTLVEAQARSRRSSRFAEWLDGENGWRRGLTADQCVNNMNAYTAWRGKDRIKVEDAAATTTTTAVVSASNGGGGIAAYLPSESRNGQSNSNSSNSPHGSPVSTTQTSPTQRTSQTLHVQTPSHTSQSLQNTSPSMCGPEPLPAGVGSQNEHGNSNGAKAEPDLPSKDTFDAPVEGM